MTFTTALIGTIASACRGARTASQGTRYDPHPDVLAVTWAHRLT